MMRWAMFPAAQRRLHRIAQRIARAWKNRSVPHTNDCATNNAPAFEPGPCDCPASETHPQPAAKIVTKTDGDMEHG